MIVEGSPAADSAVAVGPTPAAGATVKARGSAGAGLDLELEAGGGGDVLVFGATLRWFGALRAHTNRTLSK